MAHDPLPSDLAVAEWQRRAGEQGLRLVVTNHGHHWRFQPNGTPRTLLSFWPASNKAQAPGRAVEILDGPEAALALAAAALGPPRAA